MNKKNTPNPKQAVLQRLRKKRARGHLETVLVSVQLKKLQDENVITEAERDFVLGRKKDLN